MFIKFYYFRSLRRKSDIKPIEKPKPPGCGSVDPNFDPEGEVLSEEDELINNINIV